MKSIVDVVRRWPSQKAKAWVEAFIPEACSHPSVLAVVAFGAAVRTTRFTADLDLLVIYEHEKPKFEGRPIDVDIRWYERNKAESFIREGQELLGWVVRHGELLCERNSYWTKIREEWVDRMPFPSAEVAEQRVERAWRLYRELSEMGDEDAAQEQRLVGLTQEARAKLIRQRVYPASRPELPGQLPAINEVELAEKLEAALRDREQASAISQPPYRGRGEVVLTDAELFDERPEDTNQHSSSRVTSRRCYFDDRRRDNGDEVTMNLLERTAMVTIIPGFDSVPETLAKFHWKMHLSLPYPFPSKDCVHQSVAILDKTFAFSIHNHYSRVVQTIRSGESGPVYFRVFLEDKRNPPGNYSDCVAFTREDLQSVVIFEDLTDYASPKDAFAGADGKIRGCFDWLASFLSACQRAAPYLTSWLVYPISMFDVGTVYHEVIAFCANHQQWLLFSSAVAISLGRHLQRPTFIMDVPASVESNSPMDAANELLAEALMSLFRGIPRLTVLNAYTAAESLANVVFSRTKVAKLVANNVPKGMAEETVEDERKRHRTEGNFLYHRGMKSASGRSLLEENKEQYDALLKLQDLRHKVAHTGYKPTSDEARAAHKVCCEAVQWLAAVAGLSVKPLLPDASSSYPGFSTAFKDAQARSESEIELVRHLLGRVQLPGNPAV